jgi:hypothetical protein
MIIAGKFLRILIEIVKLIRSCPGRGRVASNTKTTFTMEQIRKENEALSLLNDHWTAMRGKRMALASLKQFQGLKVHPKATWEVLKWSKVEENLRKQMHQATDEAIPTDQLYHDLYAES